MTRAADRAEPPFEAPPAAFSTGDPEPGRRPGWSVAAAVLVVLAMLVPVTLVARSRAHHPSVASPNPHPTLGSVTAVSLAHDKWSSLPTAPIVGRTEAVGVWTGTQMIVWGGGSGRDGAVMHADGAAYDPSARTWHRLPPSPLSPRLQPASVWTGTSVFIWGGIIDSGAIVATDGALYSPADRTWSRLPTAPVTDYGQVQAFWTGSVVVLLTTPQGSGNGTDQVNAQSFDPATRSWARLPDLLLPVGHAADVVIGVGAGNRVYLWSQWSLDTPTGPGSFTTSAGVDGYTYEVDARRWVSNTLALPDRKVCSTPLWTGRDIVMPAIRSWLGASSRGPSQWNLTGVVLVPASAATRSIRHGPVDDLNARYLWTGNALPAFDTETETSDANGHVYPGRAAAWDPTTNTWSGLPDAPLSASDAVAVWTGKSLLIWGQLARPHGGLPATTTGLEFGP